MSTHTGHFSLWGDFNVEEITELLGMEPSWVLRKGEKLDDLASPAKSSTWDIHCPPETGDSMEEQIHVLLDLLTPKGEALKLLASKFHADMNVVGSSSVLNLGCEVLQKLAALNLNLNCFYVSGENENGN